MSICENCLVYNCCTIIPVPTITSDVIYSLEENSLTGINDSMISFTVSSFLFKYNNHEQ